MIFIVFIACLFFIVFVMILSGVIFRIWKIRPRSQPVDESNFPLVKKRRLVREEADIAIFTFK